MPSTTRLHIRMDDATELGRRRRLALGPSKSQAVRLFLRRIVIEQGLPSSPNVSIAETRVAMRELRAMASFRFGNPGDTIGDIENITAGRQSDSPATRRRRDVRARL